MIINDLDDYYIVFDTKNRNTELDTLPIIYYLFPNVGLLSLRSVLSSNQTTKQPDNKTTKQQPIIIYFYLLIFYFSTKQPNNQTTKQQYKTLIFLHFRTAVGTERRGEFIAYEKLSQKL